MAGENRSIGGKIAVLGEEPVPSATLSTTSLIWTDKVASLALKRLTTDSLWHGTKIIYTLNKDSFPAAQRTLCTSTECCRNPLWAKCRNVLFRLAVVRRVSPLGFEDLKHCSCSETINPTTQHHIRKDTKH
jgi:hypothetical protein